jgi:hypothetical protein
MPREYNYKEQLDGSYRIDPEGIERLARIVSAFTGTPCTIRMDVAGTTISSADINELLSDTTLDAEPVTGIDFTSTSEYSSNEISRRATIYLSNAWFSKPVEIRLSGDPERVRSTREEIKQLFRGVMLPLSKIYASEGGVIKFFVVGLTLFFLFLLAVVSVSVKFGIDLAPYGGWVSGVAGVLAGLCAILRLKYIPRLIVNIGASGRRHRTMARIRNFLLAFLVLGIAASIAGSYLFQRIPGLDASRAPG